MALEKNLVTNLKVFLKERPFDDNLCQYCFFNFYIQLINLGIKKLQLFDNVFYDNAYNAYIRLLAVHLDPDACLDYKTFYNELSELAGPKYSVSNYPFAVVLLLETVTETWQFCSSLRNHPGYFFREPNSLIGGIERLSIERDKF